MVTWDSLARAGVGVDLADKERTPPQFRWVSHNYWRTPQPQVNRAKLPRKHAERKGTAGRQCRAVERFGQGTVCQENCVDFIECEPSCQHNASVSNRETTAFMLKYHDGLQWGLHAIRGYEVGEFVGEYMGEVVSGTEGRQRKRGKTSTSPSYLLAVGP